jgi:hypothetical protein
VPAVNPQCRDIGHADKAMVTASPRAALVGRACIDAKYRPENKSPGRYHKAPASAQQQDQDDERNRDTEKPEQNRHDVSFRD